jgi:hypothetical protein
MIYVDNFYLHPLAAYREMRMSHLFSYHEDALHEFAARLGLRRSWFHRDHYDVGFNKRDMALTFGARGISYRMMARMVRTYRKSGGTIITIPRRGHV